MSLIEKYELLKQEGTLNDRIDYILSIRDNIEIEVYLKKLSIHSFIDLQMLIFLSKSIKNQINLIEIIKNDSLPIHQRANAAKIWLQLEQDEKQIYQFIIEIISDLNIPRLIKYQILKYLHHIHYLKKSSSFFYNLACYLTELYHHDEFNIDAHTLPFCRLDQIMDLLSRWSLTCYSQIYYSSSFCSKLIRYQPLIIIYLIKNDLNDKYTNDIELNNYFRKNKNLFELLTKKVPKSMCHFAIEHINRLEKHKRILPAFIISNEKYLFDKAPNDMIQLIILVASHQPGIIKYEVSWDPLGTNLGCFSFPHSFSINHYIRLFFALYDTCKWSLNNTVHLIQFMLSSNINQKQLSDIHKRYKWFFNMIIKKSIGKDEFLNKLLKNTDENILHLLKEFSELTIPYSRYLFNQLNKTELINPEEHVSFLRYEHMTSDIFNKFLLLFQQCSSDINQRKRMYVYLLDCAIYTDQQNVNHVLQWIQKRFINEQLIIIEYFLRDLSSFNDRFHLIYLPDNFSTIEAIMKIAFNHLQRTSTTVEIILNYALQLLIKVEYYQNKQQQEKIQEFACKIIKQYYSINTTFPSDDISLTRSLPMACNLFADILISDIFPKLLSKYFVTEINTLLMRCFHNVWYLPQIDLFLHSFFFEHLRYSIKLQRAFNIDEHSFLISLFLKSRLTQLERVYRLLNDIDQIFFLHIDVQRIVLCSQQYQQLIDKLLKDEKCININKLSKEQSNFNSNKIIPGFHINILNNYYYHLTKQQQKWIAKIILNDYLQNQDVSNLEKLKALRVLRRLTYTYHDTLEWIENKQNSFLSTTNDNSSGNISVRGANIQTINYYILCLPATFDLIPEELFKQFNQLITQLNTSNATYVRDAILSISQKLTDQYFLKRYIELIHSEHFSKLGITAQKALLRLMIQYRFNSTLITSIIKPLWESRPHPDIRACIIMILIQFIHELNVHDDESDIWLILEQAAYDDYHPVVLALFGANQKGICQPSKELKVSSIQLLQTFVKRIQMKILEHPTSLTGRIWAWSLLDSKYCNINILIEKTQQICIQFDKNANILWKYAFEKILSFYKLQKISANDIGSFIQSILYYEKEIDSNKNAIDDENDLPIYHRINELLEIFISSISEINIQERLYFRSFAVSILQFEITMAPLVGKLLIKLAENKEDLEEILILFQQHLSPVYFEHVIVKLATYISTNDGSCPFVQQLNIDEKFHLALWFINEKNQPLFVFDLLKNQVFNKISIDKQQCQILLRQMRQSNNLLLRQQALEYKVPWKKDETINNDNT